MYYDFYAAKQIKKEGYSMRSLIMAAMFRASSTNQEDRNILKAAYPNTFEEWINRTGSPDGFITERERTVYGDPGEPE